MEAPVSRSPAARVATGRVARAVLAATLALLVPASVVAAGPPFPDPTPGIRVYDEAGMIPTAAKESAEATIRRIGDRTGAEVAVYTQVVEDGRTTEEADQDALALMNQWGVGRKGFDDGLVILFDMYPGLLHGQVILYGGAGFRASYLDNAAKQRIFDEDMLPRLRQGDYGGALVMALRRVEESATPEHAASLQRARQIDAVAGLLVAPLLAVGLLGWTLAKWLRFGRDPVYLDDPSIHMAGPPEALTPATAVFVLEGRATRRALTAAMLDIASRGHIAFREEHGLLGLGRTKVGIDVAPPEPDPQTRARQLRNDARPLGPAETGALRRIQRLKGARDGYIKPDELLEFGTHVSVFNTALETEAVARGWFAEKPSRVVSRWVGRGTGVGILGGIAVFGGVQIPSNGLLFIGIALIIAGVGMALIGRSMPAVSLPGAMIRAMLAAYRRTLKKTMDQARSMDQVVAEAGLPWLETPDQAVVWGTALGLHHEIEGVLSRSLDDQRDGRVAAGSIWTPVWYSTGAAGGHGFGGDFAGASPGGGSIFSSSAVPNLGGMMSALGTIGNAPSSSGGGGGGFGGGGGGGGGGGSGGGF